MTSSVFDPVGMTDEQRAVRERWRAQRPATLASEVRLPRIGYWWCFCCEHDLWEIKTQQDVEDVLGEREYFNIRVWETRADALMELIGKPDATDEEIAERP